MFKSVSLHLDCIEYNVTKGKTEGHTAIFEYMNKNIGYYAYKTETLRLKLDFSIFIFKPNFIKRQTKL